MSASPWRAWPLRKPALTVLAVGFIALLAIWSVTGLLYMWLLDNGPVGDADRAITTWVEQRRTEQWNTWSRIGTAFSDTIVKVALVAVVGTTMIVSWRRWHDGLFLACVVMFEASVFVLSSFIVGRDRPPVETLDPPAPSGSFPSGHAAAAVAFYGGLLVIGSWHTRRIAVRAALTVVAVVIPLVVAAARVYRGMHHPIDVVAGLLLGVASLVVVEWAFRAGVADLARRASEAGSIEGADVPPDHVLRLELATDPGATPTGPPATVESVR
jgi:membrane-associated phospholipid phosphatase